MEQITTIALQLMGVILFALLIVVLAKYRSKLKAEIETGKASELDKLIFQFVSAADQLLKAEDPTGEKRQAYIYELLTKLSVVITDIIKAKIEANVLKMPKTITEVGSSTTT